MYPAHFLMIATTGSDLVTVCSAFIALIAAAGTIAAAVFNWWLYRLQVDPDVIVYVAPDKSRAGGRVLLIIIENIGKGPARDVRFQTSEPIPGPVWSTGDTGAIAKKSTLTVGIPLLAPGQQRSITWGTYIDLHHVMDERLIYVHTQYRSDRDPNCKGKFPLEIWSFAENDASDQNYPKKAADALKDLADTMRNAVDRMPPGSSSP